MTEFVRLEMFVIFQIFDSELLSKQRGRGELRKMKWNDFSWNKFKFFQNYELGIDIDMIIEKCGADFLLSPRIWVDFRGYKKLDTTLKIFHPP